MTTKGTLLKDFMSDSELWNSAYKVVLEMRGNVLFPGEELDEEFREFFLDNLSREKIEENEKRFSKSIKSIYNLFLENKEVDVEEIPDYSMLEVKFLELVKEEMGLNKRIKW